MFRRIAPALVALLVASACGGSGGNDERADAPTGTEATNEADADGDEPADGGDTTTASTDEAPEPLPAECVPGPFTADVRFANAYAELEVIEDPAFAFTDAVAVRLQPGSYTVFAGDWDLDPTRFASYETQHPEAGHTMVTMYLSRFSNGGELPPDNPPELVVGDVVSASEEMDGSLVFGLTAERGLEAGDPPYLAYNASSNAEGQVTVLGINDDHLCLAVEYLDYEGASSTNGVEDVYPVQKRFTATITAEIIDF